MPTLPLQIQIPPLTPKSQSLVVPRPCQGARYRKPPGDRTVDLVGWVERQ